jgi:hypothetical protein
MTYWPFSSHILKPLWCFHFTGNLVSKADIWMWRKDSSLNEHITRRSLDEGHRLSSIKVTFIFYHRRQLHGHLMHFLAHSKCGSSLSACASGSVWVAASQKSYPVLLKANRGVNNCEAASFPACLEYIPINPVLVEHTDSSSAWRKWWGEIEAD